MVLYTVGRMSEGAAFAQDPKRGLRSFICEWALPCQAPSWYPVSVFISGRFRQCPVSSHCWGTQNVFEEEIFGRRRLFAFGRAFHRSAWPGAGSLISSDAGEPTCTTIESWESSAVIGESGMRGGGDDLSSIILADQLATNYSPGSNVASPICSQSACGH